MKKILIFLCCLILVPVLGCLLSVFWYSGANTFWKPIDYFPYPVQKIIAVKPFGKEFWVETSENAIYKITYPCAKNQTCWTKTDSVPTDLSDGLPNPIEYKLNNDKCENDNFIYPLFRKIRMCMTTIVHHESLWTTSLALTDNGSLWIWNKPWDSPYNELSGVIFVIVLSVLFGIITSIIWNQKFS